jgi:NAD+ kinase
LDTDRKLHLSTDELAEEGNCPLPSSLAMANVQCGSLDLQRVTVAYKEAETSSEEAARKLVQALKKLGCQVLCSPSGPGINPYPQFQKEFGAASIDLAVVLGGDGSTLAAARHLAPLGVPILAINIGGNLGFLTQSPEVLYRGESGDLGALIQRLQEGDYYLYERSMLRASCFTGTQKVTETAGPFHCLNEMILKPSIEDRLPTIALELSIDGEVVDQYHGDGIIISTPTGSTSYTLSANGPILSPDLGAVAITPICPLSLSSRPIVLPASHHIEVRVCNSHDHEVKLWADGILAAPVGNNEWVSVEQAPKPAQFLILEKDYSYFATLREKLHWGSGRPNRR